MCNQFTLHNFRINTGRTNLSKRQTVFFLLVDPMDKEHKDPDVINQEAPRLLHGTIRKSGRNIKTRCIWVDMKLAQRKGFKFYQTRSTAIILYHTPSLLYPERCSDGTGEVIYEKVYVSPRPPPKISLKHDWMKELGSEVAGGSEDSNKPNQNQNTIIKHGGTCEE